ncbi:MULTISPECIES: MFS transporter [unclassified Nocardioides]|uniref:MFS transporter n=1 Tax=unclassified Nocardioides TaxID=2615069 RepID=UPI0030153A1E
MTVTQTRPLVAASSVRGAVLVALVLTALNLRTAVTGFAVLTDAAGRTLDFGPVVAGAIGSIVTGCFAAAAFAAPGVVRRLGLERTAAVALLATTAGIVLRAVAWSPAALLVASAVAFLGVGASNVILIPIVREHFPDRVRSISLLYLVLLQVGQLVAPLVSLPLAHALGWRTAAGAWAVLTGAGAALWVVVAVRTRAVERTATEPVAAEPGWWRTPVVLGLIGLMSMTTLHTYTLVTWFPTMLRDAGTSATTGALMLSWFAGLGLVGAFAVPALAARLRSTFPIALACTLLMAVGYLGMLAAPAAGAVVWALAFGLGVSTFPLCLVLIASTAQDARRAGRLSGLVQGVGYGVGCLGPLTLGALNQLTGGWDAAYLLLLATLVITAVSGWFASRGSLESDG